MTSYLIRRVLQLIPVALIITLIVFVLLRVTGDPVALMLGEEATPEQIEAMRRALGLDRPLYVQYGIFLLDLVRGDFGASIRYGVPALSLALERLPATMELALFSLLIAVGISIPAGLISAIKQYSVADYGATTLAVLGQAMPNYWLGIMLILVFGVQLGWLPVSGRTGAFRAVILPAITLGTSHAAVLTRLIRSSMLEVIRQDYVVTARSKGLSERTVIFKHALRNAITAYVTVLGLRVAILMGGAMITEQVFAWPGMGRLAIASLNYRDMPVVQAIVMIMALVIMGANLTVDLMYAVIDPRITYE